MRPYSKIKFGENGVDIKKKNLKFIVRCSRPQHDLKFDHFKSLSRRERKRNVSKCKTLLQGVKNYCLLFCFVLFCFTRHLVCLFLLGKPAQREGARTGLEVLCEVLHPTLSRPERPDHNTGNYMPYSLRQVLRKLLVLILTQPPSFVRPGPWESRV